MRSGRWRGLGDLTPKCETHQRNPKGRIKTPHGASKSAHTCEPCAFKDVFVSLFIWLTLIASLVALVPELLQCFCVNCVKCPCNTFVRSVTLISTFFNNNNNNNNNHVRNLTVTNWAYAQTTVVVGSKSNFACGVVLVINVKFRQNRG